ncbi:MAG: hypothetical protein ACRD63_01340 [Pyrinomonadaceae bacterium]
MQRLVKDAPIIRALKVRHRNQFSAALSARQKCGVDLFQTFHVWLPSACAFGAKNQHNKKQIYKTELPSNIIKLLLSISSVWPCIAPGASALKLFCF